MLLVEDAPEFAQLATDVLTDAGFRVRSVSNIADAIASMNASMPDLVVLDLGLPDGDGLDLCQSIREHSNAYVIVVSGRASEADKLRSARRRAELLERALASAGAGILRGATGAYLALAMIGAIPPSLARVRQRARRSAVLSMAELNSQRQDMLTFCWAAASCSLTRPVL